MDQLEDYFLSQNKSLEETIDFCLHSIESRLNKLYNGMVDHDSCEEYKPQHKQAPNSQDYMQFRAPYIKDFRGFSPPNNDDVKQIRDLTGNDNIDALIKTKSWSKESKHQLLDVVLGMYSQSHLLDLLKQKNTFKTQLSDPTLSTQSKADIERKLQLIDEQTDQVKSRKEPKIFVPQLRNDPQIDWLAVSAKLAKTYHDASDCRLMWVNELHWSINNGSWSKDEDVCLLNAVDKYGKQDWDSVATELNNGRLPWQCCARYQQQFANYYSSDSQLNEDDTDKIIEIINLCRIGNFVPWNQVMYFVRYHNLLQVKYQWNKFISGQKSTQSWTHHEDVLLLKYVRKFGDRDWNRISNFIQGRTNKSCRERYMMRLKFDKRAIGCWRKREDKILLDMINEHGTNWSLITTHLPERNQHQIRSRYELLRVDQFKTDSGRAAPIKHRKLHRDGSGKLVIISGRRNKATTEREIDERLSEILSTYSIVKTSSKTIVCRSYQDERIHQEVVDVTRCLVDGSDPKGGLLRRIIEKSLRESVGSRYNTFSPSLATLNGFKAWTLQQDYLSQFSGTNVDSEMLISAEEYYKLFKVVVGLFLWPAILTRLKAPTLNTETLQIKSIIERDAKNLYKVREIQKQIASQTE